jgi:hypothetical protein
MSEKLVQTFETTKGEKQTIEIHMPQPSGPDRSFSVNKLVSQDVVEGKAPVKKYTSIKKDLALFIEYNFYIQFKHHMFETNNPDTISLIEGNNMFGKEIFLGEFPKHIKDRFEEDRKYLTRDAEMFTPIR